MKPQENHPCPLTPVNKSATSSTASSTGTPRCACCPCPRTASASSSTSPRCRKSSDGATASCCRSGRTCTSSSNRRPAAATQCDCGHVFCDWQENWKMHAHIYVREDETAMSEVYPKLMAPDTKWQVYREYYCPQCGAMHDVEAPTPWYPVIHDFEPDIDAFYQEWVKLPCRNGRTEALRASQAGRCARAARLPSCFRSMMPNTRPGHTAGGDKHGSRQPGVVLEPRRRVGGGRRLGIVPEGRRARGRSLRSLVDASCSARCRPRSTRTPAAARSRWPTATSTCCASASANCWRPARR